MKPAINSTICDRIKPNVKTIISQHCYKGHPGGSKMSWDPNASMSFTCSKGLTNKPGENNCFLNSAVQVLWHLDIFRRSFRSLTGHACMGNSCIFCALKVIFTQFQYSDQTALPPDALRKALAKTFADQQRFQLGLMDDAAECFENILLRIHFHIANHESEDMCNAKHCIPHQKFAMTLVEQIVCQCGATSEPLPFTQMVHYVSATSLVSEAKRAGGPEFQLEAGIFGQLLRNAAAVGDSRQCPGPTKCGQNVEVRRNLMNSPDVISIGMIWDSDRCSPQHISDVLRSIGTTIRLNDMYHVVDDRLAQRANLFLVGIVCYYGKHYSTFFFHQKQNMWIYFDDATVKEIGPDFKSVIKKCCKGHYQPLLLLYSNPNGDPLDASTAPQYTIRVPPTANTDSLADVTDQRPRQSRSMERDLPAHAQINDNYHPREMRPPAAGGSTYTNDTSIYDRPRTRSVTRGQEPQLSEHRDRNNHNNMNRQDFYMTTVDQTDGPSQGYPPASTRGYSGYKHPSPSAPPLDSPAPNYPAPPPIADTNNKVTPTNREEAARTADLMGQYVLQSGSVKPYFNTSSNRGNEAHIYNVTGVKYNQPNEYLNSTYEHTRTEKSREVCDKNRQYKNYGEYSKQQSHNNGPLAPHQQVAPNHQVAPNQQAAPNHHVAPNHQQTAWNKENKHLNQSMDPKKRLTAHELLGLVPKSKTDQDIKQMTSSQTPIVRKRPSSAHAAPYTSNMDTKSKYAAPSNNGVLRHAMSTTNTSSYHASQSNITTNTADVNKTRPKVQRSQSAKNPVNHYRDEHQDDPSYINRKAVESVLSYQRQMSGASLIAQGSGNRSSNSSLDSLTDTQLREAAKQLPSANGAPYIKPALKIDITDSVSSGYNSGDRNSASSASSASNDGQGIDPTPVNQSKNPFVYPSSNLLKPRGQGYESRSSSESLNSLPSSDNGCKAPSDGLNRKSHLMTQIPEGLSTSYNTKSTAFFKEKLSGGMSHNSQGHPPNRPMVATHKEASPPRNDSSNREPVHFRPTDRSTNAGRGGIASCPTTPLVGRKLGRRLDYENLDSMNSDLMSHPTQPVHDRPPLGLAGEERAEWLCSKAEDLIEQSLLKEKEGDLPMSMCLCTNAITYLKEAMTLGNISQQSVIHAQMKHNTSVLRSRKLHRMIQQTNKQDSSSVTTSETGSEDRSSLSSMEPAYPPQREPLKNLIDLSEKPKEQHEELREQLDKLYIQQNKDGTPVCMQDMKYGQNSNDAHVVELNVKYDHYRQASNASTSTLVSATSQEHLRQGSCSSTNTLGASTENVHTGVYSDPPISNTTTVIRPRTSYEMTDTPVRSALSDEKTTPPRTVTAFSVTDSPAARIVDLYGTLPRKKDKNKPLVKPHVKQSKEKEAEVYQAFLKKQRRNTTSSFEMDLKRGTIDSSSDSDYRSGSSHISDDTNSIHQRAPEVGKSRRMSKEELRKVVSQGVMSRWGEEAVTHKPKQPTPSSQQSYNNYGLHTSQSTPHMSQYTSQYNSSIPSTNTSQHITSSTNSTLYSNPKSSSSQYSGNPHAAQYNNVPNHNSNTYNSQKSNTNQYSSNSIPISSQYNNTTYMNYNQIQSKNQENLSRNSKPAPNPKPKIAQKPTKYMEKQSVGFSSSYRVPSTKDYEQAGMGYAQMMTKQQQDLLLDAQKEDCMVVDYSWRDEHGNATCPKCQSCDGWVPETQVCIHCDMIHVENKYQEASIGSAPRITKSNSQIHLSRPINGGDRRQTIPDNTESEEKFYERVAVKDLAKRFEKNSNERKIDDETLSPCSIPRSRSFSGTGTPKPALVKRRRKHRTRKSVTFCENIALVAGEAEDLAYRKPDYITYLAKLGHGVSADNVTGEAIDKSENGDTKQNTGYDSDYDGSTSDSEPEADKPVDRIRCSLCRKRWISQDKVYCAHCEAYMSRLQTA
ncbi:unnamed protein product [Owenia fusiformis]|uniref:Uncharacterized protein n=1 Tax=Owenia fusiformis TaxID=6347 RepID=A0A8J1XXS2_OWEFU|nr:unnamed protein product [Owenia fusiformis]